MVGYSMQTVLTAWRLENKLRYASMTLLDIHDDIIYASLVAAMNRNMETRTVNQDEQQD